MPPRFKVLMAYSPPTSYPMFTCPHFGSLVSSLHLQPFSASHGHQTVIYDVLLEPSIPFSGKKHPLQIVGSNIEHPPPPLLYFQCVHLTVVTKKGCKIGHGHMLTHLTNRTSYDHNSRFIYSHKLRTTYTSLAQNGPQ